MSTNSPNVLRYECEDPEFAGAYVEFTRSWTRRETREAWANENEDLVEFIATKIISIYLPAVDPEKSINSPEGITVDSMDDLDTRLYTWFITAWVKCMSDLTDLGNALGRTLYGISDTPAKTTKATPEKTGTTNQRPPAHRRRKN